MPSVSDPFKCGRIARSVPAEPALGADWLDIAEAPGLPVRDAVLEWSDRHARAVVLAGCLAVGVPLIAALCFG